MKLTISRDQNEQIMYHWDAKLRDGLLDIARFVVGQGGQVVVQDEFINDKPSVLRLMTTAAQIDEWKQEMEKSKADDSTRHG